MKNKSHIRTLAVTLAVMFSMAAFSTVAYAGGGDYYDEINNEPIPETTTEPQPLTPEGNLSLVDDIEGEASEDKQFITVVSKNGNYFYIIIDRAAEGENTVHFLNLVDEADLLALMDIEEMVEVVPICSCSDKCEAGNVNTACAVCKSNMSECMGKEVIPDTDTGEAGPVKKSGSGILSIVLILAVLGGGAFFYIKYVKPKRAIKGGTDLDELDFEDDYEETELEVFENEEIE